MKIYLVRATNPANNKAWAQAFETLQQAVNASNGLIEPKITVWEGATKVNAFNRALNHILQD